MSEPKILTSTGGRRKRVNLGGLIDRARQFEGVTVGVDILCRR